MSPENILSDISSTCFHFKEGSDTPMLVRSPKLSNVERGQMADNFRKPGSVNLDKRVV